MDCLEGMKQIDDESIDMILCDLPYGTTALKWDKCIDLKKIWEHYNRIIKTNGAIVLFSSQPFTTDLINSNRKMFRYEIIWRKTQKSGFFNANKMPLKAHENILVFYKKLPTYNPIKFKIDSKSIGRTRKQREGRSQHYNMERGGQYTDTGERFPTTVIEFSNWNGALFGNTENATKHPTQKPVDLCEYFIATYTNEGDLILDNCMGSGTTAVACININRNFIGFELDKEYCEIANNRIQNICVDAD